MKDIMIENQLYQKIKKSVEQTLQIIGIEAIRQMSWFTSSQWCKKEKQKCKKI